MIKQTKKILFILTIMLLTLANTYSFEVEVVNTNPSPVTAGEYADITLRITNPTEDTRNNVVIKVESNDDFYPLDSDTISLSKVYGKESLTKTVRVFFSENIPEGDINLPILITYDGIKSEEDVSIFIQDDQSNPELHIGEISTTPDELLPDTKDNKIVVTLQNLGDKDAELVSVKLIADKTKIKSSNSFSFLDSVSSIKAGEEAQVEFTIDVEEGVFGEVDAKLALTYRAKKSTGTSYDTFEKEIPFALPITDAPYLKIVNVEQLDPFTIGSSENVVRVTLKNEGQDEANEVRVRVVQDSSYPFAYEQLTEYVTSKIEVGEEVTVDFKVEVLSTAEAKAYPTTVLLESLVGETRYTQDDFLTVEVFGEKQSTNVETGTIVLIVVFIVSFAFGITRILKRRKSKK